MVFTDLTWDCHWGMIVVNRSWRKSNVCLFIFIVDSSVCGMSFNSIDPTRQCVHVQTIWVYLLDICHTQAHISNTLSNSWNTHPRVLAKHFKFVQWKRKATSYLLQYVALFEQISCVDLVALPYKFTHVFNTCLSITITPPVPLVGKHMDRATTDVMHVFHIKK